MRALPVALVALLALTGLAAAAGPSGFKGVFSWRRGRGLKEDPTAQSDVTFEGITSGSNSISLTVKQRTPFTLLRYGLYSYNSTTNAWNTKLNLVGDLRTASTEMPQSDSTLKVYQVTLSSISTMAGFTATGYYKLYVGYQLEGNWFPSSTTGPGVAVGMPGSITVAATNVASTNKLRVTMTQGLQNTAGAYRYKVYKFGTDHSVDSNVVYTSPRVEITPWISATTVFDTPDLSPGLYSVWVQAEHKDYGTNTDASTLFRTATSPAGTSYAIGTANAPGIVRADEPTTSGAKFVVYFKYPDVNNVQNIGYTLEDVNSPGSTAAATCGASECNKIGTKYLATVTAAGSGAPTGATHKLETGTAPKGLYKIKLWGINDVTTAGTASAASAAVATFDTPGTPDKVYAIQSADQSNTLTVQFIRVADKIGSAYYFDVKDAAGNYAQYGSPAADMRNLPASIADISQDSLQFTTPVVLGGNKRYRVVVHACTGQGTNCSGDGPSNLAGIGQPSAPQNVAIAAGMTTLTVTWDSPTTDTASNYTVRIYSDTGATTFSAVSVASYPNMPWNNDPAETGLVYVEQPTGGQPRYTYTTPTLTPGIATGYYRAEVLAQHPRYTSVNSTSGTSNTAPQRAALGDPGTITVVNSVYQGALKRIEVTFSEASPQTAERYAVTVYSRDVQGGSNKPVASWSEEPRTVTVSGSNKKFIINTADDASPAWPGPGRYVFVVHAGNAAGGATGYNVASVDSEELRVGPPGKPTTTATDTDVAPIDITLVTGTPDLADYYGVEVTRYNYKDNKCSGTDYVNSFDFPTNSDGALVQLTEAGVTNATYCLTGVAWFYGATYSQEPPTIVHLGLPTQPSQPTLSSGKMQLGVTFACPTTWNSRYMTFELKRVDKDSSTIVLSSDPSAANKSPRLVRGTAGAGEWKITENWGATTGTCSFTITTEDLPGTDNDVGQYQIKLVAHNGVGSRESVASATAWLGEPAMPTSVAVHNSETVATTLQLSVDVPPADVHGGYALRLDWLHAGKKDAVKLNGGSTIYTPRTSVDAHPTDNTKWLVTFDLTKMTCGSSACGDGRYQITYFAALSRFTSGGAFIADPQYESQTGNYQGAYQKVASLYPTDDIYIGNPTAPTGLTILNVPRRIYDPTTNTLNLQIDVPEADVAKEYEYEIYYYSVQKYDAGSVVGVGKFTQDSLTAVDEGGAKVFKLAIDLTKLDCDTGTEGIQACASTFAGSYRLKSFTAVSRVTGAGTANAAVADLSGLTTGGDVIVETAGGTLAAAQHVHIPNVALAATPGDTVVYIEVDAPAGDNLMGWTYELQYWHGTTRTAQDVQNSLEATTFYVSRLDASVIESGTRLRIPLAKLSDLRCSTDGSDYTANCAAGGRFSLQALIAYSWFDDAGLPVAESSYSNAQFEAGFTVLQDQLGSPRTASTNWHKEFFVGAPVAPTGIREPGVLLASSPLNIYITPPAADNAYAYSVTLERLPDGAATDGSGTSITLDVFRGKVSLVGSEYKLEIPAADIDAALKAAPCATCAVAGRYRLTGLSAVPWSDVSGASSAPATFTPLRFAIGEPTNPATVAVTNTPSLDTSIKIQMDAPSGDVHGGFVLQLKWWHAGQDTVVQSQVQGDGATIFATYAAADRSSDSKKWTIPFPFADMKCGSNACAEGRYEVVKFGMVSLFDDSGALVGTGDYKAGKKVWVTSPPTGSNYYGNPLEPQGLSIVSWRIYDPTANTLDLQINIPERDVAKEYEAKLYYYPIQNNDTGRLEFTKTISRFPLAEAGGKLTLSIDLSSFTCGANKCGAGSYRLKSFTAVSRVTGAGTANAAVADLSGLTDGGDVIVENLSEGPEAPLNVFIANQPYLDPQEDTLLVVELELPDKDNIMGWQYELDFEPGQGDDMFTKTPVKDATGTTANLYTPRLSATHNGGMLTFTIKLADLQCTGGSYYGPCSGGKFSLKSFKALSWFTATGNVGITSSTAATRGTADSNSAYTKPDKIFGSPLVTPAREWDGVFYVGAPSKPIVKRHPNVTLTTSPLVLSLEAQLEDNVYSYKVTLERLAAGQADGQGTSVTLELYRGAAGVITNDYTGGSMDKSLVRLTITSAELQAVLGTVAGRYRMYGLTAVSWFGDEISANEPDEENPFYFIIGSPSDTTLVLNGVPSIQTGTTVEVTIDKPDADVAKFYTVDVEYYSGKAAKTTLQAAITCRTTFKQLLGSTAPAAGAAFVVRCPTSCVEVQDALVYTDNPGSSYLYTSSICRAAIHVNLPASPGGPFLVTLVAGLPLDQRTYFSTDEQNGVTPSEPTGLTEADNFDFKFLATDPLPASTTTFVVPRWGGARVSGNNLVLPIDLSQATCQGSTACAAGKFLVKKVTAHPFHSSGYTGYVEGVSGTQSAGPRPTFTYLGDPEIPTGVAASNSDTTVDSFAISFDRPESDTAKEYYVEVNKYFPGDDTSNAQKCSGTYDMPDATADTVGYTDSGTKRTIELTNTMMGGCSLAPGKFRVTTFKAVSRFNAGSNNYDKAATAATLKIGTALSVDSYFYIGPVDIVTSVTVPDISEANSATVNSLVVDWSQTSPDAAKTASYKLYRQAVGAGAPEEKCGQTDLSQANLDAVQYKDGSGQPLTLTVDLCAAAKPLPKGRYYLEWTVNGQPSGNTKSYTAPFFYVGDTVSPGKPVLTNNIAASTKRLEVEFSTPATDNAESYKYDLVKVKDAYVTVPRDATTSDAVAGYTFVSVHTDQALPANKVLGTVTNTFYMEGLAKGLYRVRVTSVNPNKNDARSSWSEVVGTDAPETPVISSAPYVESGTTLNVKLDPPTDDTALFYTVEIDYYNGKENDPTTLSPPFTVMRFGTTGSFASFDADGKLVLPIDLSQANCRTSGTPAEKQCGDGKYLVTKVKAHRWVSGGSSSSDASGVAPSADWTTFTFVGHPVAPTLLSTDNSDTATGTVTLRFARPDVDNAKEYAVVLTQYYPGGAAVAQTCSGKFTMPTNTDGTAPTVDDSSNKRVISVSGLQPAAECGTLLGKYRVTELKAVSWFTAGSNNYDAAATDETLKIGTFKSVDSYFYIGPVGAVTYVSSPDVSIATTTASTLTSLTVHWEHDTVASGYPAKQAKYTLKRYYTGDTSGEEICADQPITAGQMDSTAFKSGSTTRLELAVGMCGGATLAKGRYKLTWDVIGNPSGNTQTYTSADFFFIGDPQAPGTAPTVQNDVANSKLVVRFKTPTIDNAGSYKYDLVKVDSPSITVGDEATADGTGFTFVTGHTNQDLPAGATLDTDENQFSLSGLPGALYRVRVKSVNPNGVATSSWSAAIGTGTPVAPVISAGVDGVANVAEGSTTLTVKLDRPTADVALYYTLEVDYYSGKDVTPNPKTLAGPLAGTTLLDCSTTGDAVAGLTHAAGNSLAVRCPASCATEAGPVYTDGAYLSASSVCRAAIHKGVLGETDGGAFRVTLKAGADPRGTWQEEGSNSVTPVQYEGPALTPATNLDMVFEPLPTETNAFTIMRWGGANSAIQVEGTAPNQKLVLSVELSQADCRTGGTPAQNKCGNGKYVVRQVKAFSWYVGGSYLTSGGDTGVPMTSDRTLYTFVGDPAAPTNVVGVSADAAGPSLQFSFDRPEADNAKEYTVVVKQYFPGDDEYATCTKTFSMPTDGTNSDISDSGTTRTITVRDLSGTGCSTLRGKYRVTSLTATTWHTGGSDGVFTQATFTTATYFYIGPVGSVTYLSSPDVSIAVDTASTLTSLTVHWDHSTVPDGYAAKQAKYTLKRYYTGDTTTGTAVCTNKDVTAAEMDSTIWKSGSTTRLQVAAAMCGAAGSTVPKGRYKLTWDVIGNPASNTQTYTSDAFFFIGDPSSPGKPTLTNDIATVPKQLTVEFKTPTIDNAGSYKYDLVEVANPTITVPDAAVPADGSATTFTFVTGHSDQVLPAGATLGATDNSFSLSGLADKLYRVRVIAVNNNGEAKSSWSEVIGTGPIAAKAPEQVSVVDGEDELTVTFSTVAGALGYRYTIYTEESATAVLDNHQNVEIATGDITWSADSSEATFKIVDKTGAALPDGRYTVAIAPKNTDATGADKWGTYTRALNRAAVGTPGPPTTIVLENTPDGTGLKVGSLTVKFTKPSPDSGLEYWYALYKADKTDDECYVTLGTKVATSTALLEAAAKTFELTSLPSADYQVRVGVKNGLTTGDSSVAAKLCSDKTTTTTLDTDVIWSDLSTAIVAVDNPDQPGKPSVEYIHDQNKLVVTFKAPATGRFYTYKVVDNTRSDAVQVAVGTPVKIDADRPSENIVFNIQTNSPSAWQPGFYKVIVYVQNDFASTTGIESPASDGTYVGTPDPVTAVLLENTATDGTITVKYTPPSVDIANLAPAGSYRYTVMGRDSNCDWQAVSGKTDIDVGKPSYVSGSTSQRTFQIAGLAAGLYQVKVWGLIVHPNGKDGSNNQLTVDVTSSETTSSGDHSDASKTYMRDGTIGVGTPGVPQVSLAGAVDGMTIRINSITGNDNALSYKWVYLKDADTDNADVGSQLAAAIPLTAATQTSAWMGYVDPLVVKGRFPVSYKVPLGANLCGANRDAACEAGTYRVGIIAVNGFEESDYALTTVAASSIMGLPATPTPTSLVVRAETMETLDFKWQISNKWTALLYRYSLRNAVGTDTYGTSLPAASASNEDQDYSQDVIPKEGATYTGSGVYYLTVTAENDNGESTSAEFPDTGRVVGIPIAGGALGLRSVQVADPTTRQLTFSFLDGWNSWTPVDGSSETTYEWEVLRSPGLTLVAASSRTIDPTDAPAGVLCSRTNAASSGCSNIVTNVAGDGLPDGRYQVVVVAYNQYGYKRSAASNIVTVGAPSSTPLVLTPRDGSSQISVSFATPARPGSYECKATGADGAIWSPTVTKTLSQVTVSDDGATTRIDITSTDVPALGTTQQRWAVQCKPINSFSSTVDWSAAVVAASGAPTAVAAPTLALPSSGNGVTFSFTPATPDAAMRYVFLLEGQNGTVWESPAVAFDSADLVPAGSGSAKVYTWLGAPSGQFTGKVRSINGVGNATSPASAALAVGKPGTPGKPEAQNGQAGFVVSFNPGTPATATAFYFNIYREDNSLFNTGGPLQAPTPTTPSGGYDYSGMTPADLLSFDTGNLASMAGVNLPAGVYKIAVIAYNDKAPSTPTDMRYSDESEKSNLVSLGKPGIPTGLAVASGLRKLKVQFTPPSPDAAVYYEYTVRDASKYNVGGATRVRVERSALTNDGGKLAFETVDLNTYQLYSLRLTAVGYGSVFSSWSTSALAGMPSPAPSSVTLESGQTSLRVSFSAPALLSSTDTFAYKLYTLGATPQAVGDPNGYVVPRANFTNEADLATSGTKSFDIKLDTSATPAFGLLKAPAGGYYVEVLPARVLAGGSPLELGPASAQAGPATLGAPKAPATKPTVTAVTYSANPEGTVQWAYGAYSTYTKVEWRIKKVVDGTEAASGSKDITRDIATAIASPLSETISLKWTSGNYQGTALRGRFTVEVRMASAQGTSGWSPPSDAFAVGAPSVPDSVTISNDPTKTPSLSGTFTLPADPCYDTLSYRLVNVNEDGTDGSPVLGANVWKALAAGDISEPTPGTFKFEIPDSISVGSGSSIDVASPGRYRLDMRAATNNGAAPADYIGSAVQPTPQAPAYKGVPVAATAVSATSGATAIQLSFKGADFATNYKVKVLDNSGTLQQTATVPDTTSGTGDKTFTLDAVTLGDPPAGGATYKLKVESRNPNVDVSATGALSSASGLVIYGKLAKPAAPELVWVLQAGSDPAHAELRFEAIIAPSGANPTYEYQLYDATQSPPAAVGGWQAIDLTQATGDGSTGDKYKVRLAPSPGKYTVKLRAKTALGDSATSDESEASAEEVTGVTSQPGILAIGSGDSTIVTEDTGATTVVLLITLPTSNTGSTTPQLQLRMDTVEPTPAAQGSWANVAASCAGSPSPALCISGGAGTTLSPLQVQLTLTAADLPSPRRVAFVARTENDNGPGAESSTSNAISVGRPQPPTVTAVGSATGVEVTFTPDTLLMGDTFRYWAVDASAGSSSQTRLVESDVVTWTAGTGAQRKFTVPFADFEGNNVPYIVTVKMVAVNANSKRSADGSAASAVTVGPVTAPTGVGAAAVINDNTATVAVTYTPGDTTGIADRYRIKAYPESSRLVVLTFNAAAATSTTAQQSTTLTVGGGVGELPPGRWRFAVVAENANSQAESAAYPSTDWVSAGIPGAPIITGVDGTNSDATISFTTAADNTADAVRVYYADGALSWTALSAPFAVDRSQAVKTVTVAKGGANGLPRPGNWRFKLEAVNNAGGSPSYTASPESNAWPATTVGLPEAPTINSVGGVVGSLTTITLTLKQAEDKTATAFVLRVHDATGALISGYSAPLVSIGAPDGNGWQKVVFAADQSPGREGGSYRFKVAAINSLGAGADSALTATPVAAFKPAAPEQLVAARGTSKATLTFAPAAGALSYEAAILPASGDWRVPTDALVPYAPVSVTLTEDGSTTKLTFDVPLSAFAYRDGQYKFQVRAVDANGVRGEWSDESLVVTVGAPDAPTSLAVASKLGSSGVDLSFVPAWLAEQGYQIEVLDKDGNAVLDTLTVQSSSCAAKASAPQ